MSDLPLHRTMQDDEIDRLQAENEALRERLENYEALKRMHRLDNYPNELAAKAWLLRKQAEAVGDAVNQASSSLSELAWPQSGIPDDASFALDEVEGNAQRLRQQAKEAEQAGGERGSL